MEVHVVVGVIAVALEEEGVSDFVGHGAAEPVDELGLGHAGPGVHGDSGGVDLSGGGEVADLGEAQGSAGSGSSGESVDGDGDIGGAGGGLVDCYCVAGGDHPSVDGFHEGGGGVEVCSAVSGGFGVGESDCERESSPDKDLVLAPIAGVGGLDVVRGEVVWSAGEGGVGV